MHGDSGGARRTQRRRGWKHAGIISYGDGCAKADRYGGLSTRTLAPYIDRIRQYDLPR